MRKLTIKRIFLVVGVSGIILLFATKIAKAEIGLRETSNILFQPFSKKQQVPVMALHAQVSLPAMGSKITPTVVPQIYVSGSVKLENGVGVAKVEIYSGLAFIQGCRNGWKVATTDEKGEYHGHFGCPVGHDETFKVCAVADGHSFEPMVAYWRTYGYCPSKHTDFTAYPFPTPIPDPFMVVTPTSTPSAIVGK